MGIIKWEDIIAWEDGEKILCNDCGEFYEDRPMSENDFEMGDVVICDSCGERIL
ncbi:hypothetical protein ACFL2S_04070 [Thermodesulfobacteriota bacterium]